MSNEIKNVVKKLLNKYSWNIIPCKGKEPKIKWKEFQNRPLTPTEIDSMWTKYPNSNPGLIVGEHSRVIVLDIDQIEEFYSHNFELPKTPKAITGNGGEHYYFRYPELNGKLINNHKELSASTGKEVFSIRCKNQLALLPPSNHPDTKKQYQWAEGDELWNTDLAEAPKWILELILKDPREEIKSSHKYSNLNRATKNRIKDIKARTIFSDLLINDFNLEGKEYSDYVTFDCPFHEDGKNHGFTVWDSERGAYDFHDGKSFDVISFVESYKKLSFTKALKFLEKKINMEISDIKTIDDKNGNIANRLIRLVEEQKIEFFHDEHAETYASYLIKGRQKIRKLESKDFKSYIKKLFWDKEKYVPNKETINNTLEIFEAKASYEGKQHNLHTRVARHNESIYYDLGDDRAVCINKDGWKIIEVPPILFKRFTHQKIQAIPVDEGIETIYDVFKFVNIVDPDQQLLFISNLVETLIPDIPHPIDIFHGAQGSCKSTASRVKKKLIDPSSLELMSSPTSQEEFIQQASHHLCITLDNMTYIKPWLSDCLCRFVTGEGTSKRKLYTDDEDIIYSFRRCITINGINNVAYKPDLLERSIIIELQSIQPDTRRNEADLWKDFEENRPRILGAIFNILSRAMIYYGDVKLAEKPRMADFATWGCAIAMALGKKEEDFINAYDNAIRMQNQEVLEYSTLARLVIYLMNNRKVEWVGNATELLEELRKLAFEYNININVKNYPTDSGWVWRKLKEIKQNLYNFGIELSKDDSSRNSGGRKIIIKSNDKFEYEYPIKEDPNSPEYFYKVLSAKDDE